MNKEELIERLEVCEANAGQSDGESCRTAIRALNQCFEDIGHLQKHLIWMEKEGKLQPLICPLRNTYNPEW